MIELNKEQSAAALAIKFWFDCASDVKQTFTLAGYAGTGKTFLIKYVINEILGLKPDEVAFITPTGKAASVLVQRGIKATTIHRLIYYIDEEASKKQKRVVFRKVGSIPDYKLIVLDEVSMVEEKVLNDLLSFEVPVLCSGDKSQLPAIGKSNKLLEDPDAELTEIVRQASDNSIVKIATLARKGIPINSGNYGDVIVRQINTISDDQLKNLLLKADQILCGKNTTRRKINNLVRQYKGIDIDKDKYPKDGEKVICNVNNWEIYLDKNEKYNLVNGTIGYASNFKMRNIPLNLATIDFQPDFLNSSRENILLDSGIFKNGVFSYDMHQRAYKFPDSSYKLQERLSMNADETKEQFKERITTEFKNANDSIGEEQVGQFEFGYCISTHKSQGSEWDKVVLFDESPIFGDDAKKWLYTGITRAKKKLVIIRGNIDEIY